MDGERGGREACFDTRIKLQTVVLLPCPARLPAVRSPLLRTLKSIDCVRRVLGLTLPCCMPEALASPQMRARSSCSAAAACALTCSVGPGGWQVSKLVVMVQGPRMDVYNATAFPKISPCALP